jgi:MFS family permease
MPDKSTAIADDAAADGDGPGPGPGQAPAGTLRTLRELPRPAVVLLAGVALSRAGSFLSIFLVLYLTSTGYKAAAAGVALTVYGIGSILGTLAGGSATGRFGPRVTIVVSSLATGVAVAAFPVVKGFVPLTILCFAVGGTSQTYRPAAATLLAELTPPSRLVITSAASRLGLNVGAAAGPLLGAWLAGISYPLMFEVNAAVSVAFAIVAQVALPGRPRLGRGPATATADAAVADAAVGPGRPARYRDLLADRRFLLVLAGMFITAIAEMQYQAALPLEIRQRGLPTTIYGGLLALNGALVIAVELPLTGLIRRLPMRTTIAAGCLLLGVGLALFGVPAGTAFLFAAAVVWTLGEIISAPSIVAYPALAAPSPELRGHYIGALNTFQSAGWAIGPAIGTALFEFRSAAPWIMCAAAGLLAFGCMWLGVRDPAQAPGS